MNTEMSLHDDESTVSRTGNANVTWIFLQMSFTCANKKHLIFPPLFYKNLGLFSGGGFIIDLWAAADGTVDGDGGGCRRGATVVVVEDVVPETVVGATADVAAAVVTRVSGFFLLISTFTAVSSKKVFWWLQNIRAWIKLVEIWMK